MQLTVTYADRTYGGRGHEYALALFRVFSLSGGPNGFTISATFEPRAAALPQYSLASVRSASLTLGNDEAIRWLVRELRRALRRRRPHGREEREEGKALIAETRFKDRYPWETDPAATST